MVLFPRKFNHHVLSVSSGSFILYERALLQIDKGFINALLKTFCSS
jgi:hypothetical protein